MGSLFLFNENGFKGFQVYFLMNSLTYLQYSERHNEQAWMSRCKKLLLF
jgi:hypothetical protein